MLDRTHNIINAFLSSFGTCAVVLATVSLSLWGGIKLYNTYFGSSCTAASNPSFGVPGGSNPSYYESFLKERDHSILTGKPVIGGGLSRLELDSLWHYYNNVSVNPYGSAGPTFESFLTFVTSESNESLLMAILTT